MEIACSNFYNQNFFLLNPFNIERNLGPKQTWIVNNVTIYVRLMLSGLLSLVYYDNDFVCKFLVQRKYYLNFALGYCAHNILNFSVTLGRWNKMDHRRVNSETNSYKDHQ